MVVFGVAIVLGYTKMLVLGEYKGRVRNNGRSAQGLLVGRLNSN